MCLRPLASCLTHIFAIIQWLMATVSRKSLLYILIYPDRSEADGLREKTMRVDWSQPLYPQIYTNISSSWKIRGWWSARKDDEGRLESASVKTDPCRGQSQVSGCDEYIQYLNTFPDTNTSRCYFILNRNDCPFRPLNMREIKEEAKDIIYMDEINHECTLACPPGHRYWDHILRSYIEIIYQDIKYTLSMPNML